ncbi:MAG: hypothetical protein ACREA7_08185 [Nitrosotalea sp.]
MKIINFSIIVISSILVLTLITYHAYAQTQTPQYNFQIWPADPWKAPGYWETIEGKICPTPVADAGTVPSIKVRFGLPSWETQEEGKSELVKESTVLPSCDKPQDIATVRPNYTGNYPVYAVAQWIQNGKNQTVQSNSTQFFSQEACPIAYGVQTDGTKYYAGQTVLITVNEAFSGCHLLPHNILLKIFDVTDNNSSNKPIHQEIRTITDKAEFNFTLPKFSPQNAPHRYHVEVLYNYTSTRTVTQDTYIYSYNYANNPPSEVLNARPTQVVQMILSSRMPYGYVAYGDGVKFFGYQLDPSDREFGNPTLPPNYSMQPNGKSAIAGIQVNARITDPLGNTVYDKTETTDNNGQFPEMTFPITEDLRRGLYEVSYNATKDDGNVFMWGTNGAVFDYFVVGNETKFITSWGGKSYQFSYYGVDTDASNFVFSQATKSMTFDIKKIDGPFSRKDHIPTYGRMYNFTGYPIITIEKPLLTGPFVSVFNGKLINSYTTEPNGSENGPEMVGPVEGDGSLTFTGTYVIPEFPFAVPVLLIGIVSMIVFYRIKIGK